MNELLNQHLYSPQFKKLVDIKSPSYRFINIGLTVINNKKTSTLESSFKMKLTQNMRSILTHSSGDPLHLIIITDKHSIRTVAEFFSNLISKYISEGVITNRSWRWRRLRGIPKIMVSFADCEEIVNLEKAFFTAMKRNSQQGNSRDGSYTEDLFYIAPIYHRAFTGLDRIIFLDSKDLEFFSDIKLLEDQFNLMDKAIIGIGFDLTPHYHIVLKDYVAKHPNTSVGLPGKMQGFNTGVVLYRLDKMRESVLYNQYVTSEGVDHLMQKYMYTMFLAEQDWMTNLGFSHPHLFYHLPCQFNRQTSIDYLRPPWVDSFHSYHHCDLPRNIKIFHRNGCGPTPRCCGHQYPSKGSQLHDINVDVEQFWISISDTNKDEKLKLSNILSDNVILNCVTGGIEFCFKVINGNASITENSS
eukprot:TRINITY_DN10676_c0_g1_i1.p1 TRINITY_DN10676_c0_g1~~TRINITY_DN10676_c0_g1_i1.p1  ORF type:complete len:414 (+),score=84.46 TRINITY_DN10676_c0_g1_i1:41-1282(+)